MQKRTKNGLYFLTINKRIKPNYKYTTIRLLYPSTRATIEVLQSMMDKKELKSYRTPVL